MVERLCMWPETGADAETVSVCSETVPYHVPWAQYEPDRLRLSALDIACRVRGVIVLEWAHNWPTSARSRAHNVFYYH